MGRGQIALHLGLRGVVALAVFIVAITAWAFHCKRASAVPIPTDAIYQAQYLNLF